MTSNLYSITGHYRGGYSQPVSFSVSACNLQQARSFVHAYVPGFVVKAIKPVMHKEHQHYDFQVVNATCSASIHLRNRRATGCAVRRPMSNSRRVHANAS